MNEGGGKGSQIFCLSWVKRGAAKIVPDQITLTPEELKGVIANDAPSIEGSEDSWEDLEESGDENPSQLNVEKKGDLGPSTVDEDDMAEYDMDNYDEEEGDFSGVGGLVMFSDNKDDPYITKKRKSGEEETSDSEEEEEEKSSIKVEPDDNLLACARCGQFSSVLEIYIYNHSSGDFYVHHDIPLMETPLCMQWIGYDPGVEEDHQGNLIAVGNFNSTIDIWDLDVLNILEPVFSIGKIEKTLKKKKRNGFGHADAVLDLAWTDSLKDQLASASADTTVALWDLEFGKCTRTFRDHKNKVQTLEWKPRSGDNLISGAFDGKVILFNTKTSKQIANWSLDGEVERIAWNYGNENYFSASTDCGLVYYFDCRKPESHVYKWEAHESAVPGLSIMSDLGEAGRSLLHTASSDGFIKLWDLDNKEGKPTLVYAKNMKMGMVHCCQINPDENYVIAAGGQKGSIRLWDIAKTRETAQYFGLRQDAVGFDNDTMNPLGGSIENDSDVVKYLKGEDYINESKLKRITEQNRMKDSTKEKKKAAGSTVVTESLVKATEGKKTKKRRKKKTSNKM